VILFCINLLQLLPGCTQYSSFNLSLIRTLFTLRCSPIHIKEGSICMTGLDTNSFKQLQRNVNQRNSSFIIYAYRRLPLVGILAYIIHTYIHEGHAYILHSQLHRIKNTDSVHTAIFCRTRCRCGLLYLKEPYLLQQKWLCIPRTAG